ncbi:MAG: DUF5666 domain-containing protein, partial [Hydrogenovibrio sp.]|nr:DUF5666 domain-containing protein [Hydrogenovibrio sp.]
MSDRKSPAWQILWTLVFALFALTACQTQPTKQQVAYNGSGFGGTGKQLAHPTGGFGGTGKSSSGFGGTGIVGTITEFGSIWVNGIEIEYGTKTRIESRLTQQETLKLGQQVVLETLPTDAETLTRKIEIFYPIAGKITQVGEDYIEINRYRIRMTAQTLQDDGLLLKVGQYVAVNGYQTDEQTWVATRLNQNPEQASFYQPVPKLDFSDGVKRLIIEAGLMQFSHWSFGQEALKRSQQLHHNEERLVVEIRK